MMRKYMCKACGSVLDGKEALGVIVSSAFIPVDVKEKEEAPKPKPKVEKPAEPPIEEEEEDEDLTLD